MKKFLSSTLFITGAIVLLLAGIVGFVGLRTGAFIQPVKKVTVISVGSSSPLTMYLKAKDYGEALKVSPSSKALQVLAGYQKKDFSGVADSGLRQALEKDIQLLYLYRRPGHRRKGKSRLGCPGLLSGSMMMLSQSIVDSLTAANG